MFTYLISKNNQTWCHGLHHSKRFQTLFKFFLRTEIELGVWEGFDGLTVQLGWKAYESYYLHFCVPHSAFPVLLHYNILGQPNLKQNLIYFKCDQLCFDIVPRAACLTAYNLLATIYACSLWAQYCSACTYRVHSPNG